jgi:hypothetical protein
MRLALAIEGGFRRSEAGFAVTVEPEVARVLAQFADAEVLIVPAGDGEGELGTARLVAIETDEAGAPRVRFEAGRPIGAAGPGSVPRRGPFPLQLLPEAALQLLPEAAFLAVVGGAGGGPFAQAATPSGDIGELAVGFDAPAGVEATTGAVLATLRREVGNRCAATGMALALDALPVAIRWEGPARLHLNNLLLLSPDAETAFRQGHFTARDDFSLLVDFRRIDPELAERLNPDGRLRVPDNPLLQPSAANLAWHRRWVFGLG